MNQEAKQLIGAARAAVILPHVVLSVAAVAAVFMLAGAQPATFGFAAALAVIALVTGWLSVSRQDAGHRQAVETLRRQAEDALTHERAQQVAGLYEVCVEVLPVWSNQIEMARSHTETALTDLSMRSAHLSQRLPAAVAASDRRTVRR